MISFVYSSSSFCLSVLFSCLSSSLSVWIIVFNFTVYRHGEINVCTLWVKKLDPFSLKHNFGKYCESYARMKKGPVFLLTVYIV